MSKIFCIGGAPGVGKTTLGNRIHKECGIPHCDSDKELSQISRNFKTLRRVTLAAMPEWKRPQTKAGFSELGKKGELTTYTNMGVLEYILSQNQKRLSTSRGSLSISGLFITAHTRGVILEALKERDLSATLIYISATMEEVLSVANERSQDGEMYPNVSYASHKDVLKTMQREEKPSSNEGWERVVTLQRNKIRRNASEIPELQFLFQ